MTNKEIKKAQKELDNLYKYFKKLFIQDKDTYDENITMLSDLVDLEIQLESECNQ